MVSESLSVVTSLPSSQDAAANRHPDGELGESGNLSAIDAADRTFLAAVAELRRSRKEV
jgi:hypothetical protein